MASSAEEKGILRFVAPWFLMLAPLAFVVGSLGNLYFWLGASKPVIGPWLLKQYYVNYVDYGFAKRAAIGTIFRPLIAAEGFTEQAGLRIAIAFSIGAFALLIGAIWWFHAKRDGTTPALSAWALAILLLSPAGFVELAHDIGRYDAINILIIVVSVAAIVRGHVGVAAIAFAVAVLIHEAVFFYGLGPLAVALFATRSRRVDFVACLAPAAVVLAAIGLWGNLSPTELQLLDARPGTGTTVWSRGMIEIPIELKSYEIAALAFYLLVPFGLLYAVARHNGASLARYFVPPLATLLLFPLGFDYFRWASLGLFSVAITLLIGASRLGWRAPRVSRPFAACLLLYCLPLGPLGTAHPLPFIEIIVYSIIGWPQL